MFDDFLCKYPLPVPEVQGETFQTKSMGNIRTTYVITEGGQLTLNGQLVNFIGEMRFYTDSVTFLAHFVYGQLKGLKVVPHKAE